MYTTVCRYVQANAQSGSYPARFGYPMNWGVGGTIHNHHLAWKVDLDIAGTQNSVRTHEIKMAQVRASGLGFRVRFEGLGSVLGFRVRISFYGLGFSLGA